MVLGVIGIADIAAKIHRHNPWDFFLWAADLWTYRLIKAV
jgi:hypothetical protein